MYYRHCRLYWERIKKKKQKSKAEGDHQLQGTLTRLDSTVVFCHPTRINKTYKLNLNVSHRRHKITCYNNQGNKMHLG
jgi:aspartate carbamoyltransferase catalytic subunit